MAAGRCSNAHKNAKELSLRQLCFWRATTPASRQLPQPDFAENEEAKVEMKTWQIRVFANKDALLRIASA